MPVICQQCNDTQPESGKFCGNCGTQLGFHCPFCGEVNPGRYRYCGACGGGLPSAPGDAAPRAAAAAPQAAVATTSQTLVGEAAATAPSPEADTGVSDKTWEQLGLAEGERRKVTVLFADVSGFTAMSEKLDPEEANIIVKEVMSELSAIIRSYDGYVEKFIGDAICAIYGAPIAHEDEPERAVRTALDMHKALAARAAKHPDLPELSMHIGVNTGLVVAGTVGDGTQFGVTGDTINTAARLMDKAVKHQTFVSAETARRIRAEFLLEDKGTYQMKGKDLPVQAYEVIRELTADEQAAAQVLRAPLVGRTEELNVLLATAKRAINDPLGGAVVIVGDAGLGKTRLLEELAHSVTDTMRVLKSAGRVHGSRNFAVLAEALGPVLAEVTDEQDKTALSLLQGVAGPGSLADLQNALARVLVRGSQDKPLCILLDNMEFADQASSDLLRSLLKTTAESDILWVVAARPGPLAVEMASLPNVTRLSLRPLVDAAGVDLFNNLLKGALTPALAHKLAERAEGNPAFSEAIAMQLIDEGVVVEDQASAGQWRLVGDPDSIEIPGSLSEIIEARIDALSSTAHKTLQEIAVIGLSFDKPLLATITANPASLDGNLQELVDADLIRPPSIVDPSGDFSVKSPLVRDVAYAGILLRTRAALHRRVGDAILAAAQGQDDAEMAEILAHHYAEANDQERAVHYLELASVRAEQAYAFRRAATLCSRVLSLRERNPGVVTDAEAARLFERRGVCAMIDNNHDEMVADLEASAALWIGAGQHFEGARVQDHLAWYLALAYRPAEAEAVCDQAKLNSMAAAASGRATLVGKSDAVNTGVAVTRAFLQAVRGEPSAALAVLPELAMQASSSGDPMVDQRAQIVWGAVEHWEGDSSAARERLHRARHAALEARYPVLYAQAAWWLMLAEMELGHYARAVALGEELEAFAQETGDKLAEIRVNSALGSMLRDLGDMRAARDHSTRSLALADEAGAPTEERVPAVLTLAEAAIDSGDVPEAIARLDAAEAYLAEEEWMAWRFGARQAFVRARLALMAQDWNGAMEAAGHLRTHLSGSRSRKDYLRADLVEGEARVHLNDPAGEQLLDRAVQLSIEIGSLYYQVEANAAIARAIPGRAEAALAEADRLRKEITAAASQVSMLEQAGEQADPRARATQRLKAIQIPTTPPTSS